jgi:hypothetical protein
MERMINVEDEEDEGEKGSSEDQECRIVRLLIGSGMLFDRGRYPSGALSPGSRVIQRRTRNG